MEKGYLPKVKKEGKFILVDVRIHHFDKKKIVAYLIYS